MNTVYKQMIKSRAASSVGVIYRISGPTQGAIPEEDGYKIIKK